MAVGGAGAMRRVVQALGRRGMATVNEGRRNANMRPIDVPQRFMMGPGPSNVHPRVLAATSLPILGHMHPPMLHIMAEIQEGLKYMAQTESKNVICASGPGHAGMETVVANCVHPGDVVVIGNNGMWSARIADLVERYGGKPVCIDKPPGENCTVDELEAAVVANKAKAVFVTHGESSTGTLQPLEGIGKMAHKHGALFMVDTVCTFGGVPFHFDEWEVDATYTGSQKVLSCPPGASPVIFSDRAVKKMESRESKCRSYLFDFTLLGRYWPGIFDADKPRFYHHTGLVNTLYGMREGIAIFMEEGLQNTWKRHSDMHSLLWKHLTDVGLEPYVKKPENRLITVNPIAIPKGVDGAKLTAHAANVYNTEIPGGLGPTVGYCWRIGVMGYNAKPGNMALVKEIFKDGLAQQGWSK